MLKKSSSLLLQQVVLNWSQHLSPLKESPLTGDLVGKFGVGCTRARPVGAGGARLRSFLPEEPVPFLDGYSSDFCRMMED